jgi:hypothetical protein
MKEKIAQRYMNMMGRERMPEVCKTVSLYILYPCIYYATPSAFLTLHSAFFTLLSASLTLIKHSSLRTLHS